MLSKILISNSFGTAAKLKEHYNVDTNFIIHPIIDSSFKPIPDEEVQARLGKANINFKYLLTVSTSEPRKNIEKAIKAFCSLKLKGHLKGYKLLLVGARGWKNGSLQKLVQENQNEVVQFGYASDELLPYLYNGAQLFLFPSKYEGFGIPALEAMLCGTKVLVNDIPELREATFGEGCYVNPDNQEAFEEGILDELIKPQGDNINKNFAYYSDLKKFISFILSNNTKTSQQLL